MTSRVSNPDRSPSFRPSPSDPFWFDAFAIGSPLWINAFYRSPQNTSNSSRSLVLQFSLPAISLSEMISQEIYRTGYGRFRPNTRPPLVALVLPRLLAPVLPTTYSPKCLPLAKAHAMHEHSEFPYHTFVHCKVFVAAAPRRAGTSISVSLWGLPL